MTTFKMPENIPLEHPMVSRAIEQAQVKVEGFNFDSRKHLVDYDDVMNKQREIIYKFRREVLENTGTDETLKNDLLQKLDSEVENIVNLHTAGDYAEPDKEKIIEEFSDIIPFDGNSRKQLLMQLKSAGSKDDIAGILNKIVSDIYQQREKMVTPEVMRQIERWVSLQVIDSLWMDHLDAIDDLREGIGLRGYGQRDPLVEYKAEAYRMFEKLMVQIDYQIAHRIFKVQVGTDTSRPQPQKIIATPAGLDASSSLPGVQSSQVSPAGQKIGRNDPCPCGGTKSDGTPKKYKHCCYPKYG